MTGYVRKETIGSCELYLGDCRQTLAQLATAGVRARTCVTSPPYYGLRDYDTRTKLGWSRRRMNTLPTWWRCSGRCETS
jgi:DNA modification methylase